MKPETGRFDEDTYARARAFIERGQSSRDEGAPKPAAKPTPKPATKPKADPTTYGPRRSLAPAAKGSGRGGQGGPTAEELDAYKAKRDKAFGDSLLKDIQGRTATRERNEKLGMAADVASLAAGAGLGALGRKAVGAAASRASSTPSGQKALSALKEATAGGPRVAKTTMPSRPTAPAGQKRDVPASVRRSEEGFSPEEANRRLAKAAAEKAAPKAKKAAPKPTVSATPKPKTSRAKTSTKKFDDSEKSVEFKRGGMAKRGYGKARK